MKSRAKSPWQRFWKLPPLERGMFFRGIVLLPTTGFALRFMGLRNLECLLDSRKKSAPMRVEAAEDKWATAARARRMTEAASKYGVVRGNCLSRSIVLWHLLRRQGIDATMHVGARKDGAFEAHSWVELDGRAINDSPDVRARFAAFESPRNGNPSEIIKEK